MTEYSNDEQMGRQIEIDRFVDDELDQQARRKLLSTLEARPDGWRQLALAFVEAQTLQGDLKAWAHFDDDADDVTRGQAGPANVTRGHAGGTTTEPRPRIGGTVIALAMAASFLVAFGVASWWRGPQELAGAGIHQAASRGAADVVTRERSLRVDVAATERVVSDEVDPRPSIREDVPRQRPVEVPVVAVSTAGDDWQPEFGSALPRHLLESLQRTGYRVETQTGLHTIRLPDGRRVVIPVEQVDVHFKGNPVHQ